MYHSKFVLIDNITGPLLQSFRSAKSNVLIHVDDGQAWIPAFCPPLSAHNLGAPLWLPRTAQNIVEHAVIRSLLFGRRHAT